jgi:hypothetical protein
MTRKIVLTLTLLLAFTATAQAHGWRWHKDWRFPQAQAHTASAGTCPFDGPDRMFTIVNAGVTNVTLGQIVAVEQATRDESFALRMYYGTPCAQFGPGGTPIYLSNGYEALGGSAYTYQMGGYHAPSAIYVQTGLLPYTTWVRAFTHEVIEDLVNPSGARYFGTRFAEVCDPVENLTYEVDQLRVSDFATPAWYNGSHTGPWDAGRHLAGPA